MKTLLILTILVLICFHSASPVSPVLGLPQGCCLKTIKKPFRRDRVMDMRMSPKNCRVEAVIVTLNNDKKFCLDPNLPWTLKHLAEFQKPSN